jgi:hypothetical protein
MSRGNGTDVLWPEQMDACGCGSELHWDRSKMLVMGYGKGVRFGPYSPLYNGIEHRTIH